MGKLVNYNKRSITLPAGCKDLLDVLQPSRRSKTKQGAWVAAPVIKMDHFHTDGLAHVGEYISKLLGSASNFFMVMITHRDDRAPVGLMRNRSENKFVVALYNDEPQVQRLIKAFFVERGIEPFLDCSEPAAGGVSSLFYPLPLDAPGATALVTELLRTAYSLSDVAGLDFRYYAVDTGG